MRFVTQTKYLIFILLHLFYIVAVRIRDIHTLFKEIKFLENPFSYFVSNKIINDIYETSSVSTARKLF